MAELKKLRCGVFQVVDKISASAAGIVPDIIRIFGIQYFRIAMKNWRLIAGTQLAQTHIRMAGNRSSHVGNRLHESYAVSEALQIFN